MISPAPTREIIKQLKTAGFTTRNGKGSHTVWICPHGNYSIAVPTGHKQISPGVRSQINNAVGKCRANCTEV